MTFGIQRTAGILREVITIIMALAFTNSILVFFTSEANKVKLSDDFTIAATLSFAVLISAIVRFFHGNQAHLQHTYDVNDYVGSSGGLNRRLVAFPLNKFHFC